MIRLVSSAAPRNRDLAQQNADFTAEGSPPPGKVATMVPATRPARPVHLTVAVNNRLTPARKAR
jgi:hypothetical protein